MGNFCLICGKKLEPNREVEHVLYTNGNRMEFCGLEHLGLMFNFLKEYQQVN